MRKQEKRVLCFHVENFEEVATQDDMAISKMEHELASGGAIPAKVDFNEKILCVVLENQSLANEDVLAILTKFGLRAHAKGV